MGKVKTYFEQVPLEVVRKMMKEDSSNAVLCAICAQPVDLMKCKIDEVGGAVHEDCYFKKLSPLPTGGPAKPELA